MGNSVTQDAIDLLDAADALRAADQPEEAVRKLERALRLEGPLEQSTIAEIRLRLSDCFTDTNDHVSAQESVAPLLPTENETWRSLALTRTARAKYFLGDLETSLSLGREATQILAETNLHSQTALALQWCGNALQDLGRTEEAARELRDAVALARLSRDRYRLVSCMGSEARLAVQQCRYRFARQLYEECLRLAKSIGHRKEVARVHLNLSVCLFYLGEWAPSEEEATKALKLFTELSDIRGRALCQLALYRLGRRRGKPRKKLLEGATDLAEESSYRKARLLALEERAETALLSGDLEQAEEDFVKLQQFAGPDAPGGDMSYAARFGLARVMLVSGDQKEAETLARQALEAPTRAVDERKQALGLTLLARILHSQGAWDQPGVLIRQALRILERIETPYELAEANEVAASILDEPLRRERAHELRREIGLVKRAPSASTGVEFVVADPMTKRLVGSARELTDTHTPLLITGETGVGKALLAHHLHHTGPYARGGFKVLNCAAWTEKRMEASASQDPARLLTESTGGTLLIRGVSRAPLALQRLLVGILEDTRSSDGMGSEDVTRPRIISTSDESLERLMERARFLKELYYRLTGIVLDIPPLRERRGDIKALAEHFSGRELPEDVVDALRSHVWPGNVRELRNALAAAAARAGDSRIDRKHLPPAVTTPLEVPRTLPERIEALERREIREALDRTGNNKRVAARILGVSRKGLIDRLKRLNMWDEYGRSEGR